MCTIAIVNEKGGTGKTTTSVSLAAALGSLGQRILLVDLDGQASASRWFGVEEDDRLADAILAGRGLQPIENIAPGVSLAPATGKVDSVARDLRPSQSAQLRKVLREVKSNYDLIIMDCPPSLNNRLIGNALLAATHVLVPVETSIMALDGLQILLTTLDDISDGFEHQIVLAGVVACRYDSRTRLSRLVLEELRRALPNKVFNTVIRENVRMRECPASGQSILDFAPGSHAAEDYLALAQEMLDYPDAWRLPAHWETAEAHEINDESQRCSVDNLRSRAAATVRANNTKANQSGPASKPTGESAEPTEQQQRAEQAELAELAALLDQAESDDADSDVVIQSLDRDETDDAETNADGSSSDTAPQGFATGSAESADDDTASEPSAKADDDAPETMDYRPGPPPVSAGANVWIDRLAEAKARLNATETEAETEADAPSCETQTAASGQGSEPTADAPSRPDDQTDDVPALELEPTDEPQDSAEPQSTGGNGFETSPTGPAHPTNEARWKESPAEPEPTAVPQGAADADTPAEPESSDESAEPGARSESFPALRALLRKMGRGGQEMAGASSTNQAGKQP